MKGVIQEKKIEEPLLRDKIQSEEEGVLTTKHLFLKQLFS